MRAAIFMGLIYIGDCINTKYFKSMSDDSQMMMALFFVIFLTMDIWSFIQKHMK